MPCCSLAAVWGFLLRNRGFSVPNLSDFQRVFDPDNFGPIVFIPAAVVVLAFLLVFGLMGGWILAGRMLAPLTRIADATRLAANASHELRTPLAISKRLLDVARNGTARDQSELIERPHTVNTRAIDLTKALLLLSRGDRRSLTREPVDLSLIAEEAAETLLPLAAQRQITLDVTGEATPTVGSAALILRVVANLVQNAIVHNLPAGGTVTVHTDEHAGVGLGPAIVHSVVRAHDGILDLTPRATGGLLVTIRLPRTPHGPSPNGAR